MATKLALGIDLGATYCRAAWLDPISGQIEPIKFAGDGDSGDIPAVVGKGGNVPGRADADGADPWAGLPYRIVKPVLGQSATYTNEGDQLGLGPVGVATALIKAVKARAEGHVGRSFDRAIVAHPATYDVIAQEALRRAAVDAGFAEVELVPEPDAALAWAIRSKAKVGDVVLVCDIGTVSTTISLLARAADGTSTSISHPRVIPVGCEAVDRAIYAHLDGEFRARTGSGLGPENQVDPRNFRRCGQIRVGLAKADRLTFRVGEVEVEVDRVWLEDLIATRLDEVRRAASEAANAATNAGRMIDSALLVGGGASLPSAALLLRSAVPKAPIVPDDPHAAVAVGAAWIGSVGRLASAEAAPNPYDTPEFRAFLEEYHRKATERRLVILLAGRTGVGKSSTVNSLLGRVVARVNHYEPGTFDVTPYDTEFEGIPFRVFDTPGLCDKPSDKGNNDDLYINKMRAAVGQIDTLWFVTELFQRRPPGTDELRAIRVLSRAFKSGPEIWKCAVIIFTSANSIEKDRYEEAVRVKADQIRRAIAEHAGEAIASQVPAVAVENEADTTPDGKEWRGELYTQVCLTIAREGFASWMFATIDLVDRPIRQSRPSRATEPDDDFLAMEGRRRRAGDDDEARQEARFRLTESQEAAVRERARHEVISSYEARGAEIGGRAGSSFGSWLGGTGSTTERVCRDIGTGFGRAVGKVADWLFG